MHFSFSFFFLILEVSYGRQTLRLTLTLFVTSAPLPSHFPSMNWWLFPDLMLKAIVRQLELLPVRKQRKDPVPLRQDISNLTHSSPFRRPLTFETVREKSEENGTVQVNKTIRHEDARGILSHWMNWLQSTSLKIQQTNLDVYSLSQKPELN